MGRINHVPIGDQTGADPERVAVARERLELVHVELEPGSAIFFHSNLLHRSDRNTSPDPRWALICCYNTRSNDPYKESRHPRYAFLEKWPDERIKEVGRRDIERFVPR
jgi:ectoine hydroxylase-related dioxygenase (phytanoyl-CoA dioxygenase family)